MFNKNRFWHRKDCTRDDRGNWAWKLTADRWQLLANILTRPQHTTSLDLLTFDSYQSRLPDSTSILSARRQYRRLHSGLDSTSNWRGITAWRMPSPSTWYYTDHYHVNTERQSAPWLLDIQHGNESLVELIRQTKTITQLFFIFELDSTNYDRHGWITPRVGYQLCAGIVSRRMVHFPNVIFLLGSPPYRQL